MEWVPSLKQLLKDVFHKAITSINLGFIVYICDAHKMLYFCNQNGIVTFRQSCVFSSVSGEYRNFFVWENFGFLSFSVIVTLVGSREGLVEPLLWSFVIAPLLSFSLNFCKGTITVIVWNQNTVAMQCLQFG